MTATQSSNILRHLKSGKPITPLESLTAFGCMRLGARIWDLRQDGWPIDKTTIETPSGKHVAQYRIGPREKWPE